MVIATRVYFWVPAILCGSVGFREHHDVLVAVFSLQVVLAAQDGCEYLELFRLPWEFWGCFSGSVKNATEILMGIASNL